MESKYEIFSGYLQVLLECVQEDFQTSVVIVGHIFYCKITPLKVQESQSLHLQF